MVQEQSKTNLTTRAELDQERAECSFLRNELSTTKRDMKNLRESLIVTRNELYAARSTEDTKDYEGVIAKLKEDLRKKSCSDDRNNEEVEDLKFRVRALENSLESQRKKVTEVSKKSAAQVSGRTENMRWVNFDAAPSLIGRFVDVVITEALPNSLLGRLVDGHAA